MAGLEGLRAGDKVLLKTNDISTFFTGEQVKKAAVVEKVTKTGRIKVNGMYFLPDGRRYRGTLAGDTPSRIEPLTEGRHDTLVR